MVDVRDAEKVETIYLRDYKVPEFLIDQVDLSFDLGEDLTKVQSRMDFRKNPDSKTSSRDLHLKGEALQLDRVQLNHKLLSPNQYKIADGELIIFNVPDQFQLEISNRIKPQDNKTLSGLYRAGGIFCTQCEAQGFRRITYSLDRPDVLSRYTTTITADSKKYPTLLSNGNPIAKGEHADGRHWVQWEDPFRKPSYLFALVAGDFDLLEDQYQTTSGKNVKLQIYVDKGYLNQSHHAMQAVKKAMKWDEDNYGREYDLDIYMIVGTQDFNMGAMENKGLNIFNAKNLLAAPETATDDDYIYIESVIAHEYFHNWTGNRITCRDWFQLSIKEGLTIFRDQSFTEDTTAKTVARIRDVSVLRTRQFSEDGSPLAHPVRPESYKQIDNFYTSTVYNKGAEVARMLRTILTPALFRKAMDLYFQRHDGQAVTIEDFVKVMEDVSDLDLTQFRLWYSQAGTPVLDIQDTYNEVEKTYQLKIIQHCPPTPDQPQKKPMHIPVRMGLLSENGMEMEVELLGSTKKASEIVLEVKKSEEIFTFNNVSKKPIPSLLRGFSAPVKLKFNYTNEALATLFGHDPDGFNRWDAGQKYAENLMLAMIQDFKTGKPLKIHQDFLVLWENVLKNPPSDQFLFSQMLSLPSERYLAELMQKIDVDAICTVRDFVILELAKHLKPRWQSMYQQLHRGTKAYEYSVNEVGERQLKNLCLYYLMCLPDEQVHQEFGMKQFQAALKKNMTDTMGALRCLANINGDLRLNALNQFYETWYQQPLIVDKWFSLQACSKLPVSLKDVKSLLHHSSFDLKNPNKVYSLIGAFAQSNLRNFHDISGQGYQFLSDCVLQLNQFNPIVAARMVKPLSEWRRFDEARSKMMRDQLKMILGQPNLSKDVFELVSKSVEA